MKSSNDWYAPGCTIRDEKLVLLACHICPTKMKLLLNLNATICPNGQISSYKQDLDYAPTLRLLLSAAVWPLTCMVFIFQVRVSINTFLFMKIIVYTYIACQNETLRLEDRNYFFW